MQRGLYALTEQAREVPYIIFMAMSHETTDFWRDSNANVRV